MTAQGILPSELLREAQEALSTERGRRSAVRRRRAVSTAYYAVFHQLCRDVAVLTVKSQSSPAAHTLVRWISHGDLRQLAEATIGKGRAAAFAPVLVPSPSLKTLAGYLIELQDARHAADYDHASDLSTTEARYFVALAEKTVSLADEMRRADPTYRLFLQLALGAVKIAKTR